MNISKDGKTLYFSDEEINSETNGEKKVFVTKRINGKESHVKAEKTKKIENKEIPEFQEEIFNFNSEKVLGVNTQKKKKKTNPKERKVQKQKVNKRRKQKNKKTT